MTRIETDGSIWVIDEGAKRYCRFPKSEAGRELPEWGNAEAGVLQDAVWHDYDRWEIVPPVVHEIDLDDGLPPLTFESRPERLIIVGDDGALSAPNPTMLDRAN